MADLLLRKFNLFPSHLTVVPYFTAQIASGPNQSALVSLLLSSLYVKDKIQHQGKKAVEMIRYREPANLTMLLLPPASKGLSSVNLYFKTLFFLLFFLSYICVSVSCELCTICLYFCAPSSFGHCNLGFTGKVQERPILLSLSHTDVHIFSQCLSLATLA